MAYNRIIRPIFHGDGMRRMTPPRRGALAALIRFHLPRSGTVSRGQRAWRPPENDDSVAAQPARSHGFTHGGHPLTCDFSRGVRVSRTETRRNRPRALALRRGAPHRPRASERPCGSPIFHRDGVVPSVGALHWTVVAAREAHRAETC
ncbi:hypothetical protein E2562_033800 [Oryza meyeriana var. granulata]|uniref:Uncharacterized protein n=1 Tax=Oryza meyeriana var. granulata TaxID=110450 RepID=A0A6G1C1L6_9ORYZ|nr:hypothetical protein E2562_033800 [Oryza meyeriana var. granulata]